MSRILAVETSSDLCSVALYCNGELHERKHRGVRDHTAQVLPMVDGLLAEAGLSLQQLDALAVGRGPGSFTGLRVACSIVQGLAYGADLGVAPVSSLAAVALAASDAAAARSVLALIDARMNEVYVGAFAFAGELPEPVVAECLLAPEAVRVPDRLPLAGLWLAGSGLGYGPRLAAYAGVSDEHRLPDLQPGAAAVARLAVRAVADNALLDPARLEPVYLRNEVAQRPTSG